MMGGIGMRNRVAGAFVATVLATAGLVAGAAPQASADPTGVIMKCWTPWNGGIINDYDCMWGVIDMFTTNWSKIRELDGTCATMLNQRGRTNSYINWNCQEWPNNVYKGGDSWENL